MKKFILLCPLTLDAFNLETHDELLEAVNEFGCDVLWSNLPSGDSAAYCVADNAEVILRMCEAVELPGIVLEYSAVYDQMVNVS